MEPENITESDILEEQEQGPPTPICIRCMKPIDPLAYYCPHCGEASGQLTQYLPFVNLRWIVSVWGKMWRQVFSRDISISGRLLRFILITWNVPILLIGLFFREKQKNNTIDKPETIENTTKKN